MTLPPGLASTPATWCHLTGLPPYPAPRTGIRPPGGRPCSSSPSCPLPLPATNSWTQAPPFPVPTLAEAPRPPRTPCPRSLFGKRPREQTPRKPSTELRSALGVARGSPPRPARSREEVPWCQEQIPGALRGAQMGAGAEASGAPPQQTTLRTSGTHHGHRGRSQNGTSTGTYECPASAPAVSPPVPCIYSFHNDKSHLFIPFRKETWFHFPLSGVFCCFASTCPSLGCVCFTRPSRGAVAVVCPHVGTRVSLCGSPDLQFPGGSALGSRAHAA